MSRPPHSDSAGPDRPPAPKEPSQFPLALALVAFVWFVMELAVRLWGHPGASGAIGLEPFVLLALALGGAGLALRSHLRARNATRTGAKHKRGIQKPPRFRVADGDACPPQQRT